MKYTFGHEISRDFHTFLCYQLRTGLQPSAPHSGTTYIIDKRTDLELWKCMLYLVQISLDENLYSHFTVILVSTVFAFVYTAHSWKQLSSIKTVLT